MQVKNIYGIGRFFFIKYLMLVVFFRFLPMVFKGSISIKRFSYFVRRLLLFVSALDHNKFVRIGKNTKIDLYAPGFPSKAFFEACKKFLVFDEKMPCLTTLISITKACKMKCDHCYQKLDKGKDVPVEDLVKTVRNLQDRGVTFFNLEGGEPFLVFDKLLQVCKNIDDRSEIWINSTGDGITKERLEEIKKTPVTAIMFSLRSDDEGEFNRLMGRDDAWSLTEQGIALCHEVGISVAVNSCLFKDDFYNGNLERVMEKAKEKGASFVQIIHPKPAGGWLECGAPEFNEKDLGHIRDLTHKYNFDGRFRDYPAVSSQILEEAVDRLGCTAGGTDRFYINAKGDVQPCEFLNLSFGNIKTDDFDTIYEEMRGVFHTPTSCWYCEEYSQKVASIMKEENLKILPLSPELSRKIYKNWEPGKPTPFYEKLENLK